MGGSAKVVQGPWGRPDPRAAAANAPAAAASSSVEPGSVGPELVRTPGGASRIVLGFLVRECAVALGHAPSPAELAAWANARGDDKGACCLFGRAITVDEARIILRHPGREVTVRGERYAPGGSASVSAAELAPGTDESSGVTATDSSSPEASRGAPERGERDGAAVDSPSDV